MPIEPGQNLLHYRLIEKIGEGGMGMVWKAVDTTLDRDVAIKLPHWKRVQSEIQAARFIREARILASLPEDVPYSPLAGAFGLRALEPFVDDSDQVLEIYDHLKSVDDVIMFW